VSSEILFLDSGFESPSFENCGERFLGLPKVLWLDDSLDFLLIDGNTPTTERENEEASGRRALDLFG